MLKFQKVKLRNEIDGDVKIFKDPYVAELHKIREAYAKRFNFDLDAMFKDLKKKE